MMETSPCNTITCKRLGNIERGIENEDSSIENDFYFSYLTIDPNDEDTHTHEQLDRPQEFISIQFDKDVSLEFYETINLPTLQQMASFVVAIESWRHITSTENPIRKTYLHDLFDFLYEEHPDVEELLQYLPVPGLIRESVRKCLLPVKEEMIQWILYHQNFLLRRLKISDLLFCVWLSEGRIDYRRTAFNILSNSNMNNFDKFKIMSEYCLEEEIKKLTSDWIPERFVRRITFDKNPLLYYWFCYMNDDLDKFRKRCGESMEGFLITCDRGNTWSAMEYFWDRLNINQQISKALVLLSEITQFQRQFFSKMNQFQKYHVLSTIPLNIMINFWNEQLYELFSLTYIRFGNVITEEQFVELISSRLDYSLPKEDDKISCLVKIWNHSSDDYKDHALQSMTEGILNSHTVLRYEMDYYCVIYNIDFLTAFLSWGSAEFRRNTWLRRGDQLALCNDFSTTDKLMQLCIPDANDVALFKTSLLRSNHVEHQCFWMLRGLYGDIKELANFLHHFISNPDDRIKLIDRTLVSSTIEDRSSCCDPMKPWNSAIELIDQYFNTYPSSKIMKYKRRIIWSSVKFLARSEHDYKHLHQFLETITRVLDDDMLKRFKKVALRRFQRQYHWIEFDKIKIHQFLLWCLNYDYVEMRKFVKSLSIDFMYLYAWEELKWDRVFDDELACEVVFEKFAPVDKILLWYFEKPDLVKEYKLKKVFGYKDSKPAMFVKYRTHVDEVFIKNVLPWFFDNDREEIGKFKELFKDDKISQLIDIVR